MRCEMERVKQWGRRGSGGKRIGGEGKGGRETEQKKNKREKEINQ